MTSILQIKNLSKTFHNTPIIHDINIDIHKGEILTMVGPSGSGKSTLLRCINRLIEPDTGNIFYNNQDYSTIPITQLRKNILLVPQDSIMFSGTIKENISYGLTIHNIDDETLIEQSLIDAGLPRTFLKKNAEKLSGGEKKRVALARALALNPDILLLDEPTSGVDPKNIQTVEQNITDFTKQRALTVIWVTHNVEQAKRVSHRIANLKQGTIATVEKTPDFQWEAAY